MKIRRYGVSLLIVLVSLSVCRSALGNGTDTHRRINEKVFIVSSIGGYFDNSLLIDLSKKLYQDNKLATAIFQDAGEAEDSAPRWLSHYHDPTQALFYAGLKNGLLGWSNLEWAQLDSSNGWTWQWANTEFFLGLTAPTSEERDQALGGVFTTLGHLTHLVADMASPAHVRDDAHPLFDGYEDWTKNRLMSLDSMIYGKLVFRNGFPPDNAVFAMSLVYPSNGGTDPYSPVSNLWDSHPPWGYDNGALFHSTRVVGLADYTNYNYFSDDTVFNDYSFPNREEVGLSLVPRVAHDGQTEYMLYFRRYASDDILVQYLAATDLVYLDSQPPPDNSIRYVPAHLDELCYEDYASNLVARAVSYGAALVDYFFRGKFGVTVSGTTLNVENLSMGADNGTITIYRDDAAGIRAAVPGFVDLPLTLPPGGTMFLTGFAPDPPSADNQYTLVFRGTMVNTGPDGSTKDNVVAGKVFSWAAPSGSLPSEIHVGDNPHGLALTLDGRKLYVTNSLGGTVSVVDTANRQVVKTVQVGAGPEDVAVTPDGSKAFVSNEGGRSVSVIDTGSDDVLATISGLPPWPEEIAVDGQHAYLAHWSYNALSKIDTSDYSVSISTSPMRPCQGIVLHPEENTAYLTYYTFYWGNAVAAVDRSNGGLLATLPGPDLNWSAAVAESKRNLYVANPQINKVSIFDTVTNQAIEWLTVGGSPRGVAAAPGGAKVYVANLYDDSVSVIDTASNTVVEPTIQAGDGAYDVAVSPDGRTLYVSNAFADTVSVIPLGADGLPASPPAPLAATASAAGEVPLAAAVLSGFPAGGRVTVDGEFPRYEEFVEGGYLVWFPAGSRTLQLAFPGYLDKTIPVSAGPDETVTVDGQMNPE